jgi:hypothetical protein
MLQALEAGQSNRTAGIQPAGLELRQRQRYIHPIHPQADTACQGRLEYPAWYIYC